MTSDGKMANKEAGMFKRLNKCYEEKQFKSGLRLAKQILGSSKTCKHVETLSYKALCLAGLGRAEEALEAVRAAIKLDIKSGPAWRAYALTLRAQRKYEEAVKCFKNALKLNREDLDCWRDLSVLQIHMRDLEGFKESRQAICQLKPTQKSSWVSLAMSYHLSGEFDLALDMLDTFRRSQKHVDRELVGQFMKKMFSKKINYDYEHSELLLYQNMVIRESGNIAAALIHLEENEGDIFDKIQLLEMKGTYNLILENFSAAEKIYVELLRRNVESGQYYEHLILSKQISQVKDIEVVYRTYQSENPGCNRVNIKLLELLQGQQFESEMFQYLKRSIQSGKPAALKEINFLYSSKEKTRIVQNTLIKMISSLKFYNSFGSKKDKTEPEASFVWCHYFLSYHLDKIGKFDKALELLQTAVLKPNKAQIELLILKAKILKHKGDQTGSMKIMIEAQKHDPTDKYLGCKCGKYMIRAGLIQEGVTLIQSFAPRGAEGEAENDSPCHWFLLEVARAHQRKAEYRRSLDYCLQLRKSFENIWEDQLDFHVFCLSKMRLCSYVELLRLEDTIYHNQDYKETAHIAIEVLLKLHDENSTNNQDAVAGKPNKKKNKNKTKKEKKNHAEEDNSSLTFSNLNYLDEATRFLKPLQEMFNNELDTFLIGFEISKRKKKPLMMLQNILRLQHIEPSNEKVLENVIFLKEFISTEKNLQESVINVLDRIKF